MQEIQVFIQNNSWVFIVATVWEMAWKGLALWRAGRKADKIWFVVILVFNTVGVLPIMYLLLNRRKIPVTLKGPLDQ